VGVPWRSVALRRLVPAQQVGSLTNLPVAVLGGPLQGHVHTGSVEEGGERQDGATSDRWSVGGSGEDGIESCRIADGAERSHHRLPHEWVVVSGGAHQRRNDTRCGRVGGERVALVVEFAGVSAGHLAQCPRRRLGGQGVVVGEQSHEYGHHGPRAVAARQGVPEGPTVTAQFLGQSPPHAGVGIVGSRCQHRPVEGAEAHQRAEGGGADPGIGVGDEAAGGDGVVDVSGPGRRSSPGGGVRRPVVGGWVVSTPVVGWPILG